MKNNFPKHSRPQLPSAWRLPSRDFHVHYEWDKWPLTCQRKWHLRLVSGNLSNTGQKTMSRLAGEPIFPSSMQSRAGSQLEKPTSLHLKINATKFKIADSRMTCYLLLLSYSDFLPECDLASEFTELAPLFWKEGAQSQTQSSLLGLHTASCATVWERNKIKLAAFLARDRRNEAWAICY